MNMVINKYLNPDRQDWSKLLTRPIIDLNILEETVAEVFLKVQERGDEALKDFTQKFDTVILKSFLVSVTEFEEAALQLPKELKEAIAMAKENIEKFHAAQKTERIEVETSPGVKCWQEKRAIQKVGLYIPGGTAPLFSTILMLAVPARLAGCEEIVLCSPPDSTGKLNPAVLYAAQLCGVTKIFKIGGIQAIAGMTYGTESLPKVYKIFGPGNQYVTAAKQFATKKGVAIDMPAGPSELLIVADDTADPAFVASDLLSQAEHGTDSQVLLVSNSSQLLQEVENEISGQLKALPRREIAKAAIHNSRFVLLEDQRESLAFINEYAPEHFIICTRNPSFYTEGIRNAGSVFIGNYTPESAGDYASGTNHTLPTNGYARQYSGVNLDSFLRSISFQEITEEGINKIGPAIELMAQAEGLQAHKNAVSLRLNRSKNNNEKQL